MKFWWVNQGKTLDSELNGGFLWSPKVDANGAFNYSYQTMTLVEPGDVVFSYSRGVIPAIGVVQKRAYLAPKPDFGLKDDYWNFIGWNVEVEFKIIDMPISPKDYLSEIKVFLPSKYSPILENGRGNQKLYLVDISPELGKFLANKSSVDLNQFLAEFGPTFKSTYEDEILREINVDEKSIDTERIQLVLARRGQGVFKQNVRLRESKCRVTGVSNTRHLIASHIKPWADSTNVERIDGNNGLLLAPHIDNLFDNGFITFNREGDLVLSSILDLKVLDKWHLPHVKNVGNFNSVQNEYLEFHRKFVFKG